MKHILILSLLSLCTLQAIAQRGYIRRSIEKNYEKEQGEEGAKKGNAWIDDHLLNVDVADSYTFPTYVKMHITDYKNGKVKNESDLQYYFNAPGTIVGFKATDDNKKKKDEQFIIYDYIKNAMIMLNEKDKTGMAMNLNAFRSQESIDRRNDQIKNGKQEKSSTKCKLTGKTKTIRGYSCSEYVCYDAENDTRIEAWVTSKISWSSQKMDARHPLWAYYKHNGYSGMMLEGRNYKGDELTSVIEVLDINQAANYKVNTKEYEFNIR